MRFMIVSLLVLGSFSSFADDCLKVRAAFDVGSGTTKMKVAKVNVCEQKIVEMLLEKDIPVAYKAQLKNSKDNQFDSKIMEEGIDAILELKSQASVFNPESFDGVATSAFRTASNGKAFAQNLKDKTGVNIRVISQPLEAKFGFVAASTISNTEMNEMIVWDIGGGSMQIVSYEGDGVFKAYAGQIASETFKDYIIESIQYKQRSQNSTPNPISAADLNTATNAAKYISSSVLSEIKAKIESGAQVFGIGGVLYHSVRGQIYPETKTTVYTLAQLQETLDKKVDLSDEEIGGKYAKTEVSNLALVLGFMEGLKIQSVKNRQDQFGRWSFSSSKARQRARAVGRFFQSKLFHNL